MRILVVNVNTTDSITQAIARQAQSVAAPGTEIIGATEPQVDAELIAMGHLLFKELGLSVSLELNSLGCPVCRPPFKERLVAHLEGISTGLCEDCRKADK